jgi:hypothetical protein
MNLRILPLGIKNRSKTELPALIALEAIGQDWFNDNHRCDLVAIAMVSQLMSSTTNEIHIVSEELISFLQKPILDKDEIRSSVIKINMWLQKQPNGRVQAAIDKLLGRKPKSALQRMYG